MSRPKKYLLLASIFVSAVFLAWILGTEAGHLINRDKSRSYEFTRSIKTERLMEEMPLLVVGDSIPDHQFYLLDNSPIRLSQLIEGNTVITFFDPTCEPCIREMEDLVPVLISSDWKRKRLILISSSDVNSLIEFRRQFNFSGVILSDYGAEYSMHINVKGYPLNLLVDSTRVLRKVYAGEISSGEFDSAIADD